MGWTEQRHRCNLPLICHGSQAKVGRLFECDHCKAQWQVQGTSRIDDDNFGLAFQRLANDTYRTYLDEKGADSVYHS
jgi:hypothetical protein